MELLKTLKNEGNFQIFTYGDYQIRAIEKNGEAWLVAQDICDILELKDVTSSLRLLDNDEKMTLRYKRSHSGQRGGAQFYNFINEPGLYRLTFRSNKPEAKNFTRWVVHEILPLVMRRISPFSNEVKAITAGNSTEILVFNYGGHEVRAFEDFDERDSPYFSWDDIAAITGSSDKQLKYIRDLLITEKVGAKRILFAPLFVMDILFCNKKYEDFYRWITEEIFMKSFTLNFEGSEFHILYEKQKFWFVIQELYGYLGIADENAFHLEDYRAIKDNKHVLNEDGLYCIVRTMDTLKANKFYDWFTKTVVKHKHSLRKDIAKI